MEKSFAEHARVVEAVLNRDADAAGELIKDHIQVQNWRFSELRAQGHVLRDADAVLEPDRGRQRRKPERAVPDPDDSADDA